MKNTLLYDAHAVSIFLFILAYFSSRMEEINAKIGSDYCARKFYFY